MDKQNIINDILQMSDTSPALVAQQQHRNMAAGIGPTSKSRIEKKKKRKQHISVLTFLSPQILQPSNLLRKTIIILWI